MAERRDRCGFTWDPEEIGQGRASHQFCCYRRTWGNHDRCVWHAEVGAGVVKPLAALEASREPPSVRDLNVGVYESGGEKHSTPAELLCGASLTGMPLRDRFSFARCWLASADLGSANLAGADLAGAELWRADLRQTALNDAGLRGASMRETDLARADLRDATIEGADLAKADLQGASLERIEGTGADLGRADLSDASLENADLAEANLSDATLVDASLRQVTLTEAKLRDADLSEASLWEADLSRAYSRRADFGDAYLFDADLDHANLGQATLVGAHLWEADLADANLFEADLAEASLRDADLTGAYLREADLTGANLEGAGINRADLFGTTLTDAKLFGATLTGARINRNTRFFPPDAGRSARRCAYDPANPRTEADNPGDGQDGDGPDGEGDDRREKAADTYREIETLAQQNSFPRLQSEMFVRRQDMQTEMYRQDGDWPNFAFSRVSRSVLKYGESYGRILAWASGIVLGFALLYPLGEWIHPIGPDGGIDPAITWGRIAEDPLALWDSIYYSGLTFTPGGTPGFRPVGDLAELLTVAETAVGAFLLALLVFVFGRRAGR